MYNPMNDIQGKWEISNMDDAHFYRMGTWADRPQMGLLGRILRMGSTLFGGLRQRPATGNQPPYQAIDKRTPRVS
jgi:hypothetical protein